MIENTIQAWKKSRSCPDQLVVLSGRPYSGKVIQQVQVVEGLDYTDTNSVIDPKLLKQRMEDAAISTLGELPDVWHIHNHSLGKNPGLSGAVAELAHSGAHLLLQPHDFAEDGRPDNFSNLGDTRSLLYPTGAHIHYAVLNRRDQVFLQTIMEELPSPVHLLANAIPDIPETKEISSSSLQYIPDNLFLYPVRAVRRKNLGELVLLAMSYPEFHFANSLGPTNPSFLPLYQSWIEYAREHELAVTFGLGECSDITFAEMVNHAKSIINVSVAEGFGLGFLEPWTFRKSLCGRNLSEITSDFSDLGVKLDHMYEELFIDPSFIDLQELRNTIYQSLRNTYYQYQKEIPDNAIDRATESIASPEGVKFGRLNENMQKDIIHRIKSSRDSIASIRQQAKLEILNDAEIDSNRSAVNENFSLSEYGNKVFDLYQDLVNHPSERVSFADGNQMLEQFLCPERFNLLRA